MKMIVLLLLCIPFFWSCVSKDQNENDFTSSTIRIRNHIRTLGMVGEIIETLDNEVATGVIMRNRIRITSVGEGSTLLGRISSFWLRVEF